MAEGGDRRHPARVSQESDNAIQWPKQVGPYRLGEELGRGGMGQVFLAEQSEPVHRQVALKLLRTTSFDREAMRRFEAEREAMARVNHPNVAQVFDAGVSPEGIAFIAMELVEGIPISAYCNGHWLDIDDRLQLFISVCEGVQHAHHKGIIHRDLKPSNVLVSVAHDQPIAKIIDFGIAKAVDRPLTEGTLLTGGRVIGTPAYLSPESIEGPAGVPDVDTRADVYALGIMLYELVVGVLPFDAEDKSFLQMLRIVNSQEILRPSVRYGGLRREQQERIAADRGVGARRMLLLLRGDLDWIILKATARDRARRYSSAAELAADLRRHLNQEPVLAGPPSARYRLAKLIRRHRTGAAAVVIVALSLVGGIASTTLQARRANREAVAAQQASREAEEVVDFLVGLFAVSDPAEARGNTVTAREILDKGAGRIASELAGQPQVQARLLLTIGTVYRKLGLYKEAAQLLEQAVAQRRIRAVENPRELAASLVELAMVRDSLAEFDNAEALYREALQIHERTVGADHPETALALSSLAVIRHRTGDFASAEALYARAIAIQEKTLGSSDLQLAATINNLALLYRERQDYARAAAFFERAYEIKKTQLGPDDPRLASSLNNLAGIAHATGDLTRAESLYRLALELKEKTLGPGHADVATTLNNLGTLYTATGAFEQSAAVLERALAIREASLGATHPRVAATLVNLGDLRFQTGDAAAAEPLYERAAEIMETSFGPGHPSTCVAQLALARGQLALSRPDDARELYARLVAVAEAGAAADQENREWPTILGTGLLGLGEAERALGATGAAERAWLRALDVVGSPPAEWAVAPLLDTRAKALLHLGRRDEAAAVLAALDDLAWRDRSLSALRLESGLGTSTAGV